ncbi:11-beta-hydroxysteroid dehydrogenase 1A-like isoform X2 [Cornus florida]|uniref:11-beta-hydroxysteroid dehydrogenase 1A-like isoform X2 n=1 Tax=Cornus florida TaxID=4283 RepID=UPI00289FF1EE|nr:11-beta-hydroxysteroid dehydrogenase 1A-like isoform X2 [Cornus florida]
MDSSDLIHELIYIVLMPVVCVSLCIILPPVFIFNFIRTILQYYISPENMNGKVVLITGATSGIGEQMAYQYAKRGASLVIVGRNAHHLPKVAETARGLGSPDVLEVCADVSIVEDCKRFVDEAIKHFGRLDHLVNNAGIASVSPIEDVTDFTNFTRVMDINFWGYVYPTHFAIPHLKKSKGKILAISSVAALVHPPTMGIYSVVFQLVPVMTSRRAAEALVDGVRRGERHVTEPKWYRVWFLVGALCPQVMDWCYGRILFPQLKHALDEASVSTSQTKAD